MRLGAPSVLGSEWEAARVAYSNGAGERWCLGRSLSTIAPVAGCSTIRPNPGRDIRQLGQAAPMEQAALWSDRDEELATET